MKQRIKIDGAILFFAIILTGILYFFLRFYWRSFFWDNIFDFFGLLLILKGTFLRMAARGFKKEFSREGRDLVVSGPYMLTRNPMYLGSFLLGSGFVLIAWPFWFLPFFGLLFYLRFNKQVIVEEKHLTEVFKEKYQRYCEKVPRLFPKFQTMLKIDIRETFPLKTLWNTKEKQGLIGWPILAVILESFQEKLIFGTANVQRILLVFFLAMAVFVIGLLVRYLFWPVIKTNVKKSKTI